MVHVVLSIVLAALFVATGLGKLFRLGYANKLRDDLRVSPGFWRITGVLEWAGAAGLIVGIWVPVIGVVAATALTLLMIGAASSRVRASRLKGSTAGLAGGMAADLVVAALAATDAVLIYLQF